MTTTNKVLIGVGGVTILGLGIYFITRDPKRNTTTTQQTSGGGFSQTDPTTNTTDSLGTTLGNIFADIWASTQKNKNQGGVTPNGFVYDGPADPYSVEVNVNMTSTQVKALQTTLSSCSADIKKVIDDSGGVDGILGPGTKSAYNMARKAGCINSSGQKIS